jgi:hypothetical protein
MMRSKGMPHTPHGASKHDDQATKDYQAAVAKWKTAVTPQVQQLWTTWTTGERAAFAQRVDQDMLFRDAIAKGSSNTNSTINCYMGEGQIACDNIGVTYVAPTDADEAKVRADMAPVYGSKPQPPKQDRPKRG